jgi:hypothetical protein
MGPQGELVEREDRDRHHGTDGAYGRMGTVDMRMTPSMVAYTDFRDGRAKLKTPQGNILNVTDLDAMVEVVKAAREWQRWRTTDAPMGDGFSLAERYLVDMLAKLDA